MNFLKKQGVAWVITIVMIIMAIGIGTAKKSPGAVTPEPPSQTIPPASDFFYVCDDANVLSKDEERKLSAINERLYADMGVVVACVTTRDGRSDIYKLALEYGDQIGLQEYDFIIVVDMSSQQYILVQGAGLVDLFTDSDCEEYADRWLLDGLNDGDYGEAFMDLAQALAGWYEDHYVA